MPKPSPKAPAMPKAPARSKATAKVAPPTPPAPASSDGWLPADGGYQLALRAGKLVSRNPKGKELTSVPPKLAESALGEQLDALSDWLHEHRRECLATVDGWMLRSLPVPLGVVAAVWADAAWRNALENTVILVCNALGRTDPTKTGFLRGVDATKGVGLVTRDGETRWVRTEAVLMPHPVLLAERDDWRELASELTLRQGVQQLLREVFTCDPTTSAARGTSINTFANGAFEQLSHVTGRCRQLGYPVRGGYATCTVFEGDGDVRASYWIGSDDPQSQTSTGELFWSAGDERTLPLAEVGPVAFSEGMRMAAAIYARRTIDKQDKDV